MVFRQTELKEMQFREDADNPVLSGYFVRFDDVYRINDHTTESIDRDAFTGSINGDVRALYNHNSDFILGRTSSNTLKLRVDEYGVFGEIEINTKDSMARDVYERIKRGDITGCSFGFDIEAETCEIDENGNAHWTIEKVNPLYEVSPCVFPAYESTSIDARSKESMEERAKKTDELISEKRNAKLLEWKSTVYEKLGVKNA